MNRMTLSALACVSAAAFPAAALAHGGHGDGRHHDGARDAAERFHDQDRGGDRHDAGQFTVGTVTAFDGRTLTITLGNGQALTGVVSRGTELECDAAGDNARRDGGGGRSGGSDDGGGHDRGEHHGDRGDGSGCAALLVAGTAVDHADLQATAAGAVWDEVELGAGAPHS